MTWSIVIPYQHVDPTRRQALSFVERHYAETCYPIVTGCCDPGLPWAKGVALDRGVDETDSEGLILLDADCLVELDALARSTMAVAAGAPWSMPHATVHRLSRRSTSRVYSGAQDWRDAGAIHLERPPHVAPRGGGIVVLSRAAYDQVGGIDPRFVGWGGEDISFGRALDTIVGECVAFDASLVHLWHKPQPTRPGRRGSHDNERLASVYLDAVGDPDQMAQVVER